jgi:hypothetical protein
LAFKLSPDGRYLAYFDGNQIGVRALDSLDGRRLAGTDGGRDPFWSPDGGFIGFFAEGKLKKIAVAGGPAQTICDVVNGRGASWNREGVIVFSPANAGGLYRVPDSGGIPVALTKVVDAEVDSHRFPEFLPDGDHFLFLSDTTRPETTGTYVGSLRGAPPVRILPDIWNTVYVPAHGHNGYLVFRREEALMSLAFNLDRLQVTGGATPIASPVGTGSNSGLAAFSASQEGTLAYSAGRLARLSELVWLDRSGRRLGTIAKPDTFSDVALSPDGKTVAFWVGELPNLQSVVWLQDMDRGTRSRFTFGIPGSHPIWAPDGRKIVYTAHPTPLGNDLYEKPTSGAVKEELILPGMRQNTFAYDWSPDGKYLVYGDRSEKTRDDLWLLPMQGERRPIPFARTPFGESFGQFSPDSHWLAYVCNESGRNEVYVQPVPPDGRKWQISTASGFKPRWSRDGKELFYLVQDQKLTRKLMAASVKIGASFEPGAVHELFEADVSDYQPSADGRKFVAAISADSETTAPLAITVVTNWQSTLKLK